MMRRGLLIGSLGLGTVLAGVMISAFATGNTTRPKSGRAQHTPAFRPRKTTPRAWYSSLAAHSRWAPSAISLRNASPIP